MGVYSLLIEVETAGKQFSHSYVDIEAIYQLDTDILIGTIAKVIDVAFFLLTSKARRMKYERYAFSLHKAQVAM